MNGAVFRIALGEIIACASGVLLGCALMVAIYPKGKKAGRAASGCISGYLLSTVCFSFLPSVFAADGFWMVFFLVLSGILAMMLLHELVGGEGASQATFYAVIALFTFGRGFLVGSGYAVAAKIGSAAMLAQAVQYILLGVPPTDIKMPKKRSLALLPAVLLCTLLMAAGNFVGAGAGKLSERLMVVVLSFTSGGILYASLWQSTKKQNVVAIMIGLLAGLIMAFI